MMFRIYSMKKSNVSGLFFFVVSKYLKKVYHACVLNAFISMMNETFNNDVISSDFLNYCSRKE